MKRLIREYSAGLFLAATILATGAQSARADSTVAWGFNGTGQLGDGTMTSHSSPMPVSGMVSGVTAVAAGSLYSLAVHNGAAFAWGYNNGGQLGDGTSVLLRTTPVPVSGLSSGVTAVAASLSGQGPNHSLAVQNGAVYAWGDNGAGQLGDGTMTDRLTPVPVSGMESCVTAIAAGQFYSLGAKNSGVYAWGENSWGELGDGTTQFRTTPVPAIGLESGVTAIAASNRFSLAVKDGAVYAWGVNGSGQLGIGTYDVMPHTTPAPVVGLSGIATAVAAGPYTSYAVVNGTVYGWGSGDYGAPGQSNSSSSVPVLVDPTNLTNIVAVAAGNGFTSNNGIFYALSIDGSLWFWGNTSGHLLPPAGFKFTSISHGTNHFMATLAAVPEPSTFILATAAIGFCVARRHRSARDEDSHALRTSRGRQKLSIVLAIGVSAIIFNRAAITRADTFGSGANTFSIEFVTIGNPANAADTTGNPNPAGSVPYIYRIGKFEISEEMVDKANAVGGLGITKDTRGADKPATSVSWNEAARFVNWLNTSTGSTAAYKFATQPGDGGYSANANIQLWSPGDAGYDPTNLYRNRLARYFLPSVHEWYKAAYYDPTTGVYYDYPTGSNSAPTAVASGTAAGTAVYNGQDGPANITLAGGLSPYGTMGQGGNVIEYEETDVDLANGPTNSSSARGIRGGHWSGNSSSLSSPNRPIFGGNPSSDSNIIGLRVASIPEPSTLLLLLCFGSLALLWRRPRLLCASVLVAFACIATSAQAATIEMVTVGNAGNAPDTRYNGISVGSVDHVYQIGKYEVTAGQYTEFLNAVAKDDPNGLYNRHMSDPSINGANIQQTGSSPNFSYSVAADWADRPVNFVSFWDAARFANWLHNGQPSGAQGLGTTEDGAYHDVANQALFGRNAGARFFIPTENEWYKAAYHDQTAGLAASYFDYPTGTNSMAGNDITEATNPGNNANYDFAIGSPYSRTVAGEFELSDSPYGTFDQGGNVREWNETAISTSRGQRGGSFFDLSLVLTASNRHSADPSLELSLVGFRVASIPIPEPSAILLLGCGAGAPLVIRKRSRRARYFLIVGAIAAFLAVPNAAHAAALRTVAVTGQHAPGAPEATIFGGFSAPVLNNAGQTAFKAFLTGNEVVSSNSKGMWSEGSGSLELAARAGEHAPGTPDGVTYADFQVDVRGGKAISDTGSAAFTAWLSGPGVDGNNNIGIWLSSPGGSALIARAGEQAAGTPAGDLYASVGIYNNPFLLNGAGQVAFQTYIGVNFSADAGIWCQRHGNLELVVRTGNHAPGTPEGVNFYDLNFPGGLALNKSGQTAFFAQLSGSGVNATNDAGIWSEGFGSLALVARKGNQVPGMPDGAVFNFAVGDTQQGRPAFNNAGQTAFGSLVTGGGVDSTNNGGIWFGTPGDLALVVRKGDHAPGTPSGLNFGGFPEMPALNDAGQLAFYAALTGPGVNSTNILGLWSGASGSLALVARTGEHAPGTEDGVVFGDFITTGARTPSLNAAGQTAFSARLTGNGISASNDNGIWATDRGGVLQLIAREGDLLEVAPGDLRTINALTFVLNGFSYPTGNSDGRPSAFNNLGQIAFAATFTDGTSGIFVSNRVAVPEPSTSVLAAAALGLCIAPRRRRRAHNDHKNTARANRNVQWRGFALVLTSLLTFLQGATIAHAASLRTVALSGQQMPGMPDGTVFGLFSQPVLNNAGQTAFYAGNNSIWSEGGGSLHLAAAIGQQASGFPDSVTYEWFDDEERVVISDSGLTVFAARAIAPSGTGTPGIWTNGPDGSALVVHSGEQAAGMPTGVVYDLSSTNTWRTFLVNDAAQVAFQSYFAGSGDGGVGIWAQRHSNLELMARTGAHAPGAPDDLKFSSFSNFSVNESGQIAFAAGLGRDGSDLTAGQGIWSEGSGSLALVVLNRSQAPGMPDGAVFNSPFGFRGPAFNNAGQTAFSSPVTGGGVDATNNGGIWLGTSGNLSLVVRTGDHAAGTPSGVNFGSLNTTPALNNSGKIAFFGGLTGPGVDSTNNRGLWSGAPGNLALVARKGDHAPGTDDGIVFSSFLDFSGISNAEPFLLNAAGQIAFFGGLTGSGITASNDFGIWATDRSGALQLIARTGSPLEVAPGDFHTVASLYFLYGYPFPNNQSNGNADGRPSAFNNQGQLAFSATFTDGTSGIFVSNLVAVPEPATVVLAACGLAAVVFPWVRRSD